MRLNLGSVRYGDRRWPALQILTGDHAIIDFPGYSIVVLRNRPKGGTIEQRQWHLSIPAIRRDHVYTERATTELGLRGAHSEFRWRLFGPHYYRSRLGRYDRARGVPIYRGGPMPVWARLVNP